MITPSELRIGNWVAYADDPLVQFQCDIQHLVDIHDEKIEVLPIGLTPEFLERCDFKNNGQGLFDHDSGNISLRPTTTGYKVIGTHELSVQYLHQLQNLYYSLTYTELNYTP